MKLEGHMEAAERREAARAFMAAIGQLQHGFDIVDDLSALHPTDAEGLKDLVRAQAAAKVKGLRAVVRIMKIPLTRMQLERIARETGWPFETAGSLEEADALLDAMGPAPPPEPER
jgi:hypothetical protein